MTFNLIGVLFKKSSKRPSNKVTFLMSNKRVGYSVNLYNKAIGHRLLSKNSLKFYRAISKL